MLSWVLPGRWQSPIRLAWPRLRRSGTWTWDTEGRLVTTSNPLLSANLKAKKLRTLLERQKAVKIKGVAKNWRLVTKAALANYVAVPVVTVGLLLLFGAQPTWICR
jgi:hypothetical protein